MEIGPKKVLLVVKCSTPFEGIASAAKGWTKEVTERKCYVSFNIEHLEDMLLRNQN